MNGPEEQYSNKSMAAATSVNITEVLHHRHILGFTIDDDFQIQNGEEVLGLIMLSEKYKKVYSIFDIFHHDDKARLQHYLATYPSREDVPLLKGLRLKMPYQGIERISLLRGTNQEPATQSRISISLFESTATCSRTVEPDIQYYFEAYESELEGISRVLRDDIAQNLYAARVRLQRFVLEEGFKDNIQPVKTLLNETIRKLTHLADNLFPPQVWKRDFIGLLDDIILVLRKAGYEIIYSYDRKILTKDDSFLKNCFRIIQKLSLHWEKVAGKHKITMHIKVKGDEVCVDIAENDIQPGTLSMIRRGVIMHIKNRVKQYGGIIAYKEHPPASYILIRMVN